MLSTTTLAAMPSSAVQTFVEAPGPSGPLKGTMLAPASVGAPMMLIVPGSGPTDRDGNSPMGRPLPRPRMELSAGKTAPNIR
jgi:hypothetical protein